MLCILHRRADCKWPTTKSSFFVSVFSFMERVQSIKAVGLSEVCRL
jgi:hypothetical protein